MTLYARAALAQAERNDKELLSEVETLRYVGQRLLQRVERTIREGGYKAQEEKNLRDLRSLTSSLRIVNPVLTRALRSIFGV